MADNFYGDDFVNWFGDMFGNKSDDTWTDVDELNSLWEAYDSFVKELKADGYKVLRNESGKHKIMRGI